MLKELRANVQLLTDLLTFFRTHKGCLSLRCEVKHSTTVILLLPCDNLGQVDHTTDLHIYDLDAVPLIHVVSNHVDVYVEFGQSQ